MKRKKKVSYKFAGKKHSRRGKISLGMAVASALAGAFMVAISMKERGNADVYIGSAGILSLLLAAVSLVVGISSFREESYKLFPALGSICSGLVLAGWVAIYALGFSCG
ncbi:DUF6142 family protein [Lachnospiraceae bacterium 29-84]